MIFTYLVNIIPLFLMLAVSNITLRQNNEFAFLFAEDEKNETINTESISHDSHTSCGPANQPKYYFPR